jgi:MFS family permease
MTASSGWRPTSKGRPGADAFVVSPFTRLARTHVLAVAGDTLIAIALAGSLFFNIDPTDARWKVAAYLALTMAPFAFVAPLVGPTLDRVRGGRRWMIVGANALRAVICVLMIGHVDSLLLFPEAFALLVLSKSYHVAKSAIVPTVVRSDEELVEANAKLSLLSGAVGFAAAIPGGLATLIADAEGVLVVAVLVFAAAAIVALQVPATQVAPLPATEEERAELRGGGILLAASAMGLLRGIVGFLTFLLAFDLRSGDAPAWQFGVVLAVSGVGALLGAVAAPALRRSTDEETILTILLTLTAVTGVATAFIGGLTSAAVIALAVGAAASGGKLAFDSLVQRDAPDANRGRSFARFETRFQLIWVIGAFIPVAFDLPARLGYLVVAGTAGFAAFSYLAGQRALKARHEDEGEPDPTASAPDPTGIAPSWVDPTRAE